MTIKEKAIELYVAGYTYREIEAMEGMPSRMTICRWVRSCDAAVASSRSCGRRSGLSKEKPIPKVQGEGHAYDGFDGTLEEKIRQLELENDILRGTVEVLKGASLSNLTNKEKSILIEWLRHNTDHRLKELTDFLRISKSSYEYWRIHLYDVNIRDLIGNDVERIFREDGREVRGYRFVHETFVREQGESISEKVIRDVMHKRGLVVLYKKKEKKYNSYKGEPDAGAPNIPFDEDSGMHDFHADVPNEKWVTDITEFKLPDAPKVYLSAIVDLYDTMPVGWSTSEHPNSKLTDSSLLKACESLAPDERPFCHTDRGIHYRANSWKTICEKYGITRSMSRKGRSPDNAACEGFFGRLKNEFFHGRDWSKVSSEEFMRMLNEWLCYYRDERLRSFKEGGRTIYDTIMGRRRRLGLTA